MFVTFRTKLESLYAVRDKRYTMESKNEARGSGVGQCSPHLVKRQGNVFTSRTIHRSFIP